jgi:restriction alleviation protein Lar
MGEALKPCPFCGGPATLEANFGREWFVYCETGDCPANHACHEESASAADAWNQRAAVPASPVQPQQAKQDVHEPTSVSGAPDAADGGSGSRPHPGERAMVLLDLAMLELACLTGGGVSEADYARGRRTMCRIVEFFKANPRPYHFAPETAPDASDAADGGSGSAHTE